MTEQEIYDDSGKINPHKLADSVLENFNIITTYENEEMFVYRKEVGVYDNPAETILKEVMRKADSTISKHIINEALEHIRNTTYVGFEEINKDSSLVVCANGVLNLMTLDFVDAFSPKLLSTIRIPIKYRPDADCPIIKKFIKEVVPAEDVPVIQELFGYCLWREYMIHKAFMFVGGGSNGKSTMLNLLTRFVGKDNVASVSLQGLAYNRFAPARLFGKLVNIYADIPNVKIKFTGQFKMATGQDLMPYEKKHKDATKFMNFAKLCFSANELPESDDTTDAYFRRWVIIKFPNTFNEETTDPNLLSKLTTEDELGGLLNWALVGLRRLLENGKFSYSQTQEDVKREYIKLSDSLRAFATEFCGRGGVEDYVTKEDFFGKYQEFCETEGIETKSKALIGRRLPTILPFVRAGIRVVDDKKTRVWNNLVFRKDINSIDTQDTLFFNMKDRKINYNSEQTFIVKNSVSSVPSVPSVPVNERMGKMRRMCGIDTFTKATLLYFFTEQEIEAMVRDGILYRKEKDRWVWGGIR